MTGPVPIAFYAPLKPPDYPSPSGDRTMARLLLQALRAAGYEPSLASRLRTVDIVGTAGRQAELKRAGQAEAEGLIARYRGMPPAARPRLWFTYHVHYKAPDWTGPSVARAIGIPYVVAEGSRAPKRAGGSWALGHQGAEAALDKAELIFVITDQDREMLERLRPPGQRLVDLPPFLDSREWAASPSEARGSGPTRLLAVAMMRRGDKLASYALLARALRDCADRAWTLDIVGDGPARAEVERCFSAFGEQVRFRGEVERGPALARLYSESDLLVWPAIGEAYGMALLEAQAMGCPVLAGRHGGVENAMAAGRTGELAPPNDAPAFAEALRRLLDRPERLAAMGGEAVGFVSRERSLPRAADILRGALLPLSESRAA